MRDILITLIVFGALPFILVRPWLGILMWSWLGFMNPHRLSWGFAFDFPFSQVTAVATIVGIAFTTERRFIWNGNVLTWLLLVIWMTVTTFFALDSVAGWDGWNKMIKIQLFAFLTVMLIYGRERIIALVWVVAMSLGFFGLKGGLHMLRTGGATRVWGPTGSSIADNNALAMALIMTIPLIWFLFLEHKRRLPRVMLSGLILLTGGSILGSQSRGAALAGAGMLLVLWLKSAHKLRLGLAMLAVLPFLLLSMPESYFERVETIATYEQDGSAMGRIRAWRAATQMALQRATGGGFNSIVEASYRRFAPEVAREIDELEDARFQEAHSIYFRMLGEHGIPGLLLYLVLGISAYRSAGRLARENSDASGMAWVGRLASMIQVSLVGFAVGGAFLGLSYFDLYFCILALLLCLQVSVRDARQTASEPESGAVERELAVSRDAR